MMKLVGWAQSVVTFHGGASQHLDGVAFIFRLHLVLGMTLFLLFPFSRLVHIWSVPVEYLTRKYQLVRARHYLSKPNIGGYTLPIFPDCRETYFIYMDWSTYGAVKEH